MTVLGTEVTGSAGFRPAESRGRDPLLKKKGGNYLGGVYIFKQFPHCGQCTSPHCACVHSLTCTLCVCARPRLHIVHMCVLTCTLCVCVRALTSTLCVCANPRLHIVDVCKSSIPHREWVRVCHNAYNLPDSYKHCTVNHCTMKGSR